MAPRNDVVEAVRGYAESLGVPQVKVWEISVRLYLASKGIAIVPQDAPKKGKRE